MTLLRATAFLIAFLFAAAPVSAQQQPPPGTYSSNELVDAGTAFSARYRATSRW